MRHENQLPRTHILRRAYFVESAADSAFTLNATVKTVRLPKLQPATMFYDQRDVSQTSLIQTSKLPGSVSNCH
jgi:hypothetical protein